MASCVFNKGKCHGAGDVKAALRHNDCSPKMRAVAARGNPDIDIAKSHLNVRLYGGSYAERSRAYDTRIAQLDAQPGANVRKDRVTGQRIVTPVPPGLPRDQYNAWMRRVVEIQIARYGAENVIAADGHWDEEHEYIDAETKQPTMSRVHVQTVVVPVVDGRLCGKEFFSRGNMRALNQAIQDMSKAEFGVDFMDGTGKKGTKSTEQLKAKSQRLAVEAAERAAEAIKDAAKAEAARTLQEASEALRMARETLARAEQTARTAVKQGDEYRQQAREELQRVPQLRADDEAMIAMMKRRKNQDGLSQYDFMRGELARWQARQKPAPLKQSRAAAIEQLERAAAGIERTDDRGKEYGL
uniref:Uncharacterized protein n=1 Tax=uncultured prokaryote TaxID=198431 RepID=A0A0H5QIY0_9ZZZZ|nr:hypothetical protein [uncultured prokaryote]